MIRKTLKAILAIVIITTVSSGFITLIIQGFFNVGYEESILPTFIVSFIVAFYIVTRRGSDQPGGLLCVFS